MRTRKLITQHTSFALSFFTKFVFDTQPFLKLHTMDFPPNRSKPFAGTILAFHGGCFRGGSISWDKEQNQKLADQGFHVHQVLFPTTTIADFRRWAVTFPFRNFKGPIFCLGRSSGGYLAREFFMMHGRKIKRVVYICPVFNPLIRCALFPQFEQKTIEFFDKGNAKTVDCEETDRERERLYLAHHDENVPAECYTVPQRKEALYIGPKTHSGMCTCASQAFVNDVTTFLTA